MSHPFLIKALSNTAYQSGEYWECGVFRGDTVFALHPHMSPNRIMRLFDTFAGQPYSGPYDHHQVGSMNGTSYEYVSERFSGLNNIVIHQGIMPFTFSGLESSIISVVNIDVDNHDSVRDCLLFVYPRVPTSGYIALDDYRCPDCPGAKKAVDDFLADKPEKLMEDNDQVYFIKL